MFRRIRDFNYKEIRVLLLLTGWSILIVSVCFLTHHCVKWREVMFLLLLIKPLCLDCILFLVIVLGCFLCLVLKLLILGDSPWLFYEMLFVMFVVTMTLI